MRAVSPKDAVLHNYRLYIEQFGIRRSDRRIGRFYRNVIIEIAQHGVIDEHIMRIAYVYSVAVEIPAYFLKIVDGDVFAFAEIKRPRRRIKQDDTVYTHVFTSVKLAEMLTRSVELVAQLASAEYASAEDGNIIGAFCVYSAVNNGSRGKIESLTFVQSYNSCASCSPGP